MSIPKTESASAARMSGQSGETFRRLISPQPWVCIRILGTTPLDRPMIADAMRAAE
jgi:hypothetical protein